MADRKSPGEITPPVSLHPISFDEAMKALMGVGPQRMGLGNKQAKHKPKSKGLLSPSSLGRCEQLIHRHGLDG